MPRRTRRDRAAGFTLLEVLIALVIMAIGLGALYAALAQSNQFHRTAERRAQLEQTAQSVLDGTGADGWSLGGASAQGQSGPIAWRRTVRPVDSARPASGLRPVLIEVTARDGDGRSLTLETIRLVPVEALSP